MARTNETNARGKNGKKPWMQVVDDLGIREHLDIFRANKLNIDVERIGADEWPSVEIIPGILFQRVVDQDTLPLIISDRHAHLWGDALWTGRDGKKRMDIPVELVGAMSCLRDGEVDFVDESMPMIKVATPLAFYDGDLKCTMPTEKPIDGFVAWHYPRFRGDRKYGLFLPYDLSAAEKEGWFNRKAAHDGIRVEIGLWPGVNRGKKNAGGTEPQTVHPCGLRVISPFAAFAGWGQKSPVFLTQHGTVLIAAPLVALAEQATAAAIEAAVTDDTGIDLGDGIEVGPEEVRVGRGMIRSIWDVLATAHTTKGVDFGAITRDSSREQIHAASRAVAHAIHPDKLGARLRKIKGYPASFVATTVKQAGLQYAPFGEAFNKALDVRDAQSEAVKAALGTTALEGAELSKAFKAKTGKDVVTEAIGTALGVPFAWDNFNHLGLRKEALRKLEDEAVARAASAMVVDRAAYDTLKSADDGEDGLTVLLTAATGATFSWKNDRHLDLRKKALFLIEQNLPADPAPAAP